MHGSNLSQVNWGDAEAETQQRPQQWLMDSTDPKGWRARFRAASLYDSKNHNAEEGCLLAKLLSLLISIYCFLYLLLIGVWVNEESSALEILLGREFSRRAFEESDEWTRSDVQRQYWRRWGKLKSLISENKHLMECSGSGSICRGKCTGKSTFRVGLTRWLVLIQNIKQSRWRIPDLKHHCAYPFTDSAQLTEFIQ